MVRRSSTENFERIAHLVDRVTLVQGDLLDQISLVSVARGRASPTEVYNLAAQSFVPTSWRQPVLTAEFTAVGVTRMLEAIRQVDPSIRFYQASSSEMFGKVREVPQTEQTPFYPRSPYGVAKVYGHFITVNYRESYGLFAVSGILFNHESPRRGLEFVTRKISDGVARIKLGLARRASPRQPRRRSATGASPATTCAAMWLMLQQDEPADYVIATGEEHTVREFVELAFGHVGPRLGAPRRRATEQFMRPAEVDRPRRRRVEGAARARLGAAGLVPRARRDDGRRRPRPALGRARSASRPPRGRPLEGSEWESKARSERAPRRSRDFVAPSRAPRWYRRSSRRGCSSSGSSSGST